MRRSSSSAAAKATIDRQLPQTSTPTPLLIPVSSTPQVRRCRLLRRYKRFLADVVFPEDENGDQDDDENVRFTTVHCPNTGPMTGLLDSCPRAEAWVSVADDPKGTRKYKHTLEAIRPFEGGPIVGVHSAAANKVVRALLEAGVLSEKGEGEGGEGEGFALLPKLRAAEEEDGDSDGRRSSSSITAEVSYGGSKRKKGSSSSAGALSRADFLLQCGDERGGELVLEVKSVTLAAEDDGGDGSDRKTSFPSSSSAPSRLALFPDTVSVRAQRHAADLEAEVVSSSRGKGGGLGGRRAAIVFLIQRGDCDSFSPSEACDPAYCRALRSAARAGVLVLAVRGEIVVGEGEREGKGLLFRYLGRARVELGEDDEEEQER